MPPTATRLLGAELLIPLRIPFTTPISNASIRRSSYDSSASFRDVKRKIFDLLRDLFLQLIPRSRGFNNSVLIGPARSSKSKLRHHNDAPNIGATCSAPSIVP